jgi:hypothetical protein
MRYLVQRVPATHVAPHARVRSAHQRFLAVVLLILWPGGSYPTSTTPLTWGPLSPAEEVVPSPPKTAPDSSVSAGVDVEAVEEMLQGAKGRREHWADVPELVVLTSVMQYRTGTSSEYVATADILTNDEVEGLIAELTSALALLTGNSFPRFAAVRRESIEPGASTNIIRRNQIVVGRYRDVRQQSGILGLGGRAVRPHGAITGAALVLDDEYDRTGPMRTLLRTHELGHALGYNHVQSRESIMNPRIGADPTDLDRQIATFAYGQVALRH